LDRETRRPGDQPRRLTSGTSTSASVHGSDGVDRVKTVDVRGRTRLRRTWRVGRSRTAVTRVEAGDAYGVRYSRAGLVVWASKPSETGLRVWVSKPEQSFRGGTDDTWWHRGVRVEAKLPVRRHNGRRINMKTGLDLYALRLIGLALMYKGAFREI
jgi:hypothetical protein